MRSFVISDIHGCSKTLRYLLEVKLQIVQADRLYFLGDYIDRGPDSPGVVEYLINLIESGYNVTCLRGNHEQMMLDSINGDYEMSLWLMNSGFATVQQYQLTTTLIETEYGFLSQRHLDFFTALKMYVMVDNRYILVHGGLNFESSDPFSDMEAMLWSRPSDVPDNFMPGYRIIHGHTPRALQQILAEITEPERRLFDLDAGCVYKGLYIPGTGYLTALQLENWSLEFVECID